MSFGYFALIALAGVALVVVILLCAYTCVRRGNQRLLEEQQAEREREALELARDTPNAPDVDYEALYQYYNPQLPPQRQQQHQQQPYAPAPVVPATVIATQGPGRNRPRSARYFPEARDARVLQAELLDPVDANAIPDAYGDADAVYGRGTYLSANPGTQGSSDSGCVDDVQDDCVQESFGITVEPSPTGRTGPELRQQERQQGTDGTDSSDSQQHEGSDDGSRRTSGHPTTQPHNQQNRSRRRS